MKPTNLTPAAEHDLRDALRWYAERDLIVAREFAAAVRAALALVEKFPRSGSRVPGVVDADVRRLPVRRFPYHIVYLELHAATSVLAIAHDRRRPGYWRA